MGSISWTALYLGSLALTQVLIHVVFLFSLLRIDPPSYLFFQFLGLAIMIPATLGLGISFRMARKDSLRDCMSYTLPGGLLGAGLGLLIYSFFPGIPTRIDLAFLIWVLIFIVSFGLFFLSRQMYRRHHQNRKAT
ncbi:MAG: hypothetical protein RH862_10315 [Leptospiraceae bacterium]